MLSVWFHLHSPSLTSGTAKVRPGLQSNLEPGDCSPEEAALEAGMALAPGGCLGIPSTVAPHACGGAGCAKGPSTPHSRYSLNIFSCQGPFSFSVVYFCKADKAQPQEITGAEFNHCSVWLLWVTERGNLGVHGLGSGWGVVTHRFS